MARTPRRRAGSRRSSSPRSPGAYWRGDENRQQLTRIYGTAFLSKEDLALHLERLEQARARDHRRLGRELGLFTFRPESPGIPFWLPGGMVIQNEVRKAVREQLFKRGYKEIATPHILDEELWHRSGHYENYRENMFFTEVDDRRFAVRPMNCPGACLVFGGERHSYRDLPLRLAEFGQVSRWEREGVLHGLLRVRAFTQDDAHVYCAEDQIEAEVQDIVQAIDELYETFGFDDVRVELSTRPEKSIGTEEQWEQAEAFLQSALEGLGREFQVNPGDGAFYGPKIDFHVTDALGRSWQCGTCQLDFFMPERFDLTYTGADNADHRPVMIHRALLGSVERFIGILIEHHAGELPALAGPAPGAGPSGGRSSPGLRARGGRPPGRGRDQDRGRRPLGVGREEDPRRRAAQGAVHADRGRQGGRVRPGVGAPPP